MGIKMHREHIENELIPVIDLNSCQHVSVTPLNVSSMFFLQPITILFDVKSTRSVLITLNFVVVVQRNMAFTSTCMAILNIVVNQVFRLSISNLVTV